METLRVKRIGEISITDYWRLGSTLFLKIPDYHKSFITKHGKLFRYSRSVLYGNFDGRCERPAISPTLKARTNLDSPIAELGDYTSVANYPRSTYLETFYLLNGDPVSSSSDFRAYGAKYSNADSGSYRITDSTISAHGYESVTNTVFIDGTEKPLFKVDDNSYLANQPFTIKGSFYKIYVDGELYVNAENGTDESTNSILFRTGKVYEVYSSSNAPDGSILSFSYDSKPFRKYTRLKLIPDLPTTVNSNSSEFLDLSRIADGSLTIPDVFIELDGTTQDGNRSIPITSNTKLKLINKNSLPPRSFCEYKLLYNNKMYISWRLESSE